MHNEFVNVVLSNFVFVNCYIEKCLKMKVQKLNLKHRTVLSQNSCLFLYSYKYFTINLTFYYTFLLYNTSGTIPREAKDHDYPMANLKHMKLYSCLFSVHFSSIIAFHICPSLLLQFQINKAL